jgi:hypothetical protein
VSHLAPRCIRKHSSVRSQVSISDSDRSRIDLTWDQHGKLDASRRYADIRTSATNLQPSSNHKGSAVVSDECDNTIERRLDVISFHGRQIQSYICSEEEPVPATTYLAGRTNLKQSVASLDEARANIEELRPKDTMSIPYREFKTIADVLMEGFTMAQLQNYAASATCQDLGSQPQTSVDRRQTVNAMLSSSPVQRSSEPSQEDRLWLRHRTSWTPLKGYHFSLGTPKEKVVQIIMQDRWDLQVQELLDGVGKMVVQTGERVLKLLLRMLRCCVVSIVLRDFYVHRF